MRPRQYLTARGDTTKKLHKPHYALKKIGKGKWRLWVCWTNVVCGYFATRDAAVMWIRLNQDD